MEHLTDEEYRKKLASFVENTHGHRKHCARSAVRRMIRASNLKGIDPEMAAFRALTAEEEAASALIHSLKWHRYKLSEQLKPVTIFKKQLSTHFSWQWKACSPGAFLGKRIHNELVVKQRILDLHSFRPSREAI